MSLDLVIVQLAYSSQSFFGRKMDLSCSWQGSDGSGVGADLCTKYVVRGEVIVNLEAQEAERFCEISSGSCIAGDSNTISLDCSCVGANGSLVKGGSGSVGSDLCHVVGGIG